MTRKFNSFDDYRRHLKNKYGIGEGADYKPWLTIRDVKPESALRSMALGMKTGREHHLLSSIESQLFYLLDFRDDVVDIREQFPLIPLEVSQKIANTINVKHPKVPITGTPNIMTTDFVVTINRNNCLSYVAFCVKPVEKLIDIRTLEKIEIERIWWELLEVPFFVFTGNNQTKILSRNISWATDSLRAGVLYELDGYLQDAVSLLSIGKHLKSDVCDSFVELLGLDNSDALNVLRMLIAKKIIEIDMSILIEESISITIKSINVDCWRASGEY